MKMMTGRAGPGDISHSGTYSLNSFETILGNRAIKYSFEGFLKLQSTRKVEVALDQHRFNKVNQDNALVFISPK